MDEVLKGAFILGSTVLFVMIAGILLRRSARNQWLVLLLAAWLGLVGLLGSLGFFLDFQAMPPRMPLFVLIEAVSILGLVFASPFRDELGSIPQRVLVGLQSFRIGVEIILGAMATDGTLPVEMSFHGRNFDVLTGVSAIGVTVALLAVGELRLKKTLLAWNVLGLGLLFLGGWAWNALGSLSVSSIAALSTKLRDRQVSGPCLAPVLAGFRSL